MPDCVRAHKIKRPTKTQSRSVLAEFAIPRRREDRDNSFLLPLEEPAMLGLRQAAHLVFAPLYLSTSRDGYCTILSCIASVRSRPRSLPPRCTAHCLARRCRSSNPMMSSNFGVGSLKRRVRVALTGAYKRSPGAWLRGFCQLSFGGRRSVARDNRSRPGREVIVDAGSEDVVRDAAGDIRPERESGCDRHDHRIADRAEIHVEIFDFGAPVGCEHCLKASANGPAKSVRLVGAKCGDRNACRRECRQTQAGFDFAPSGAASSVEQYARGHRETEATTQRSKPVELVRDRGRAACRKRRDRSRREASADRAKNSRATALACPLRVSLDAEHPV